jgi:hypothetical protein
MIIYFNYSINFLFFVKSIVLQNGKKFGLGVFSTKKNLISTDSNLVRINLTKFNEYLLDEHKRDNMSFIYAQKVSNDNKAIKLLEERLLFTKKNAFHPWIVSIKYEDEIKEYAIIDSIPLTSTVAKSGKTLRIDKNNFVNIIDCTNEKGESFYLGSKSFATLNTKFIISKKHLNDIFLPAAKTKEANDLCDLVVCKANDIIKNNPSSFLQFHIQEDLIALQADYSIIKMMEDGPNKDTALGNF